MHFVVSNETESFTTKVYLAMNSYVSTYKTNRLAAKLYLQMHYFSKPLLQQFCPGKVHPYGMLYFNPKRVDTFIIMSCRFYMLKCYKTEP